MLVRLSSSVQESCGADATLSDAQGWRVGVDEGDGKKGWALLRASLHDPLLVLNVESDVRGGEENMSLDTLDMFVTTMAV